MSTVTFKYKLGVKAKCTVTGVSGTISGRVQLINGSIQYSVQPPARKGTNYIPDAWSIDEASLEVEGKPVNEKVTFAHETGDRLKSRVNGFEGIATHRIQYLNGCIAYRIEGAMHEGKEVSIKVWEQEAAALDKGLNQAGEEPVKRKRTGGSSTRTPTIERAL